MPLSEHEQRILHELEQSLYQEDPGFAERVRSETVYRHAGRYCIWSALVFVAALVFMFLTFSRSVILGFVAQRALAGDADVQAHVAALEALASASCTSQVSAVGARAAPE